MARAAAPTRRANGNIAGDATRARIIAAAQRQFARKGIDAVSVRDITTAAKVNTAAIHYHFGSKQGLIEAIVETNAHALVKRRDELLTEYEARREPSLRDVVAALVIPSAELAADRRRGGPDYIQFVSSLLSHPSYMPLVLAAYEPGITRFKTLLEAVTPHLSPEVRELRFAVSKDLVNRMLGFRGAAVHRYLDAQAPGAQHELAGRLIDVITGAFREPDTTKG